MEITVLIKSVMGLVVILAGLIFLLFYSPTSKKQKPSDTPVKDDDPKNEISKIDLDSLRAIIKNKKTESKELKEALDLVLKHHGVIHKKMGLRAHPDFDFYMDILFTICRHPNTSKNIILNFDKELLKLNPDYKSEINDAITKGLNSRGA